MNHNPICISREDNSRLRRLLATALHCRNTHPFLQRLRAELDRAMVLETENLPADVVTLYSHVACEDLKTGNVEEYTITFPSDADPGSGCISILTPAATTLIGCRTGDTVRWHTPTGSRHLQVRAVTAPAPHSAGEDALAAP